MMNKASLQKIISSRRNSEFFGRKAEMYFFSENKSKPFESRKFIINISGQGGIGKTTLIRQFIYENDLSGLSLYSDENQKDPLEILEIFSKQLSEKQAPFKKISERHKKYLELKERIERDPELPKGIPSLLGEAIGKFGLSAVKEIPGLRMGIEMIGEENITKKAGELTSFLSSKIGNKDEIRLILEPTEILTPIFIEELNQLTENKHVLLVFDTYEYTAQFIEQWLLKILDGYFGEVHTNFTMAVAGRNKFGDNWTSLLNICEFFELNPLAKEEARQYLHAKGVNEKGVVEKIIKLSKCLPIWLSTLAAQKFKKASDVIDPTNLAVERFLKWNSNEQFQSAAIVCAVPRTFNRDILEVLIPREIIIQFYTWIKKQPFVTQNSQQGWSYHQIVRKIMIKHLQNESNKEWNDCNKKLIEYYKEGNSAKSVHTPGSNFADVLFHEILLQTDEIELKVIDNFLDGLITNEEIAVQIISILEDADELIDYSWLQKTLREIKNGLNWHHYGEEGATSQFLHYLNELINDRKATEAILAKLHLIRGKIFARRRNSINAFGDFNLALHKNPIEPSFYMERASLFRSENNYIEAINDLRNALKISESNTKILDEITLIFLHNLKDLDNALFYANKLVDSDGSDYNSYKLRSEIYEEKNLLDSALTDISQAISLSPNQTWLLFSRANLLDKMGKMEQALGDFNLAIAKEPWYDYHYARRAEYYQKNDRIDDAINDYSKAIELKSKRLEKEADKGKKKTRPKIGTKLIYRGPANWHERRGDLYSEQEQYLKAIGDFQLELLEGNNQRNPIVSCKIGFAFRDLNDYKNAKQYFKQAAEEQVRHPIPSDLEEINAYKGHAFLELGEPKNAYEYYSQAQAFNPGNINHTFWKSIAAYKLKNHSDALKLVDEVIRAHEDLPLFVFEHQIEIFKALNDIDGTLRVYEKLLSKSPDNYILMADRLFFLIQIGNIQNYKDDLESVKANLLQQHSVKPHDLSIQKRLAGIYSLEGNPKEASKLLRTVALTDKSLEEELKNDDFIWRNIKDSDYYSDIFEP